MVEIQIQEASTSLNQSQLFKKKPNTLHRFGAFNQGGNLIKKEIFVFTMCLKKKIYSFNFGFQGISKALIYSKM